MNIKKPLLIVGAVTAIGAAGLGGNSLVSAESGPANSETLVSKIAQKFNLKTEDVQSVFDENRKTHEAERTAEVDQKLTQLVTDGKLTAEQKDKILAKQKELQTQHEADKTAMKDKTEAERKAAHEAKRAELEKWATDNNIPKEYLKYVMGAGRSHGHGPGGPGAGRH